MKKFTLPLILVISFCILVPVYAAKPPAAPGREALALPKSDIVPCDTPGVLSKCGDGTCSTSTGSGTCSGHGGVVGTVNNSSGDSRSSSTSSGSEGRAQYTLGPALPSDSSEAIESAPTSPLPPTSSQPIITQIPASGGILTSQSVPSRLTSAISVLLILMVAAVKAVGKR